MPSVKLRELLEAGVHFGHQTGRWDPKMKPYIFAKRNGIYIIDLQKTQAAWQEALQFLEQEAAQGGKVLFVGTKRQAQDIIAEQAQRCGQFFVNHRWLGGLLTNWQTISRSIDRYREIEAMGEDGRFELLPKKEVLELEREKFKLERNLIGIKDMGGLPDVVFVVDIRRERIAVAEAVKLGIPVVAVVDTNCNPEGIDYVVPGNDDAIRSIRLFCTAAADAVLTGKQIFEQELVDAEEDAEGSEPAAPSPAELPVEEAEVKQKVSTKAEGKQAPTEKVEAGVADESDVEKGRPRTEPDPGTEVDVEAATDEAAEESGEVVDVQDPEDSEKAAAVAESASEEAEDEEEGGEEDAENAAAAGEDEAGEEEAEQDEDEEDEGDEDEEEKT